jgi:selenocysteine-specific elongation factor
VIVGTAGHIDHGKTSLVKAITGVDADRLKEEKERGITIDLGFAYWAQGDGSVIGFVDVPGHERFVHTMLAGAHGIDRLMLVVAADDGVMPQTREHLEIAGLLGLDRGVAVITKIDAVPPERASAVEREIDALLVDTPLAESPIFRVSNLTGEGLESLVQWLQAERLHLQARAEDRLFRLAVDRSFVLQGTGVVVTGMVLDGAVAVGDEVIVSPSGLQARVRSIHAQNRKAERGAAGERCALNLVGPAIAKEAIRRGDVVTLPESHAPTQRIDVGLRVASGAAAGLSQWMPARLHHATAEVGARIVLLDDRKPQPGDDTRVQLVLDGAIAARALDRFILRDVSGSRTLAGGRFIDLRAPDRRRRTPERMALLAAMALPDAPDALAAMMKTTSGAVDLEAFARDRGASPSQAHEWCERARAEVWSVGRQVFCLSKERRGQLSFAVRAELAQYHAAHPDLSGIGLERLRMQTAPRLPAPLVRALLRSFVAEGALALDGNWVRLSSHKVEITLEEENLWQDIRPLLSGEDRFRPPRVRDIAATLAESEADIRRLLHRFGRAAATDEVAHDHFFLRRTVAEMVRLAVEVEAQAGGWFTAAAFRDRLEGESGATVGRKVAIQALEFFDRHGVTIRRGDLRRVNVHRRDLFEIEHDEGRESSPVGRPDFKSGWGRATVLGGFDSHSLPPSRGKDQGGSGGA